MLLLNKVNERFKKVGIISTILFFFLFCISFSSSETVKTLFNHSEWAQGEAALGDMHPNGPKAHPESLKIFLKKKSAKKEKVLLNVPVVTQMPELPRGCEVTSLSMLLQHAGVSAGKMELAKRIKKDPSPFEKKNGQVYFGNPNRGFVGDMYNIENPGYGVYHKPIKELAEKYLPDRIEDFTGGAYTEIEERLSMGYPVWIIINARYKELPPEQFETWNTVAGKISITYREHSVLVTGYDRDNVYVNDPLTGEKNKKVPKQDFINAWAQMGRQAITYMHG
jgi:uncharacterized protein YvpB